MRAPLQEKNESDSGQSDIARKAPQRRNPVDDRPEAMAQSKLAEMINSSPRVLQQRALSDTINNSQRMVAQRRQLNAIFGGTVKPQGDAATRAEVSPAQLEQNTNSTGLPDQLKSGIESLSGMSMDHVKVHYNSGKPAQLQAHAYAQGSEIHLGAGQEKHLPHETWHVVQQAQGRVRPTLKMKAGAVNDDPSLEKEAETMGEKAVQFKVGYIGRNQVGEEQLAGTETQLQAVSDTIQKSSQMSQCHDANVFFSQTQANSFPKHSGVIQCLVDDFKANGNDANKLRQEMHDFYREKLVPEIHRVLQREISDEAILKINNHQSIFYANLLNNKESDTVAELLKSLVKIVNEQAAIVDSGRTPEWAAYSRGANDKIANRQQTANVSKKLNESIVSNIREAAARYRDVLISFGGDIIVISSPKSLFHFSLDVSDEKYKGSHFTFETYNAGYWLNSTLDDWKSKRGIVADVVNSATDNSQWLLERENKRGMQARLIAKLEAKYDISNALLNPHQVDGMIAELLTDRASMRELNKVENGGVDHNPLKNNVGVPGKNDTDAHWRANPAEEILTDQTQNPENIEVIWSRMKDSIKKRNLPIELRNNIIRQTEFMLEFGLLIYKKYVPLTSLASFQESSSNRQANAKNLKQNAEALIK